MQNPTHKVALITGSAKRIGEQIAKTLHADGYHVIIHHARSGELAQALCDELNALRPHSAKVIAFDLRGVDDESALNTFKQECLSLFGRIDCIIHNASSFYPTELNSDYQTLSAHWQDLFLTNAKAPLFLSCAFLDELQRNKGNIISILDIHAHDKPYPNYPIYTMAKASHRAMVQSLALELSPHIRVNGVSPGVNVLPEDFDHHQRENLKNSVPLKQIGEPNDIAQTVLFLLKSPYITGQIISVDGGRSLTIKDN